MPPLPTLSSTDLRSGHTVSGAIGDTVMTGYTWGYKTYTRLRHCIQKGPLQGSVPLGFLKTIFIIPRGDYTRHWVSWCYIVLFPESSVCHLFHTLERQLGFVCVWIRKWKNLFIFIYSETIIRQQRFLSDFTNIVYRYASQIKHLNVQQNYL